jgi:alkylation response protein AidB-like acyl-CoA dehydrogenase
VASAATAAAPRHFHSRSSALSESGARPGSSGHLYGWWGFTPEQEQLRDLVAKFAAAEIAPRAAEIDKNNEFPADLWKKFGDLGLLGITVKEEDGGQARIRSQLLLRELRRLSEVSCCWVKSLAVADTFLPGASVCGPQVWVWAILSTRS